MFELILLGIRRRLSPKTTERLFLDLEFFERHGIVGPRTATRLGQRIAIWDLLAR